MPSRSPPPPEPRPGRSWEFRDGQKVAEPSLPFGLVELHLRLESACERAQDLAFFAHGCFQIVLEPYMRKDRSERANLQVSATEALQVDGDIQRNAKVNDPLAGARPTPFPALRITCLGMRHASVLYCPKLSCKLRPHF